MRFNITSRRPNKWLLVFLVSRQPREVQRWRFLACLTHLTPLRRRALDLILGALEARGILDVHSRNFAPRKAGAT